MGLNTFFLLLVFIGCHFTLNAQDTWTQKADVGDATRYGGIGFSIGSFGYIGSGQGGATNYWRYDPDSDTWTQIADIPDGTHVSAASFAVNNKGYVCLGLGTAGNYGYATQNLWEYDPATNIWTQKAIFPGHVREHAIGLSIGTKGYVGLGFYNVSGTRYKDFWEYNPSSDTWTQKANFINPRLGAIAFSIGNKGFAGTGSITSGYYLKNDLWQYNPATDAWTQKADMPSAPREYAVAFSIGGKGYVGTGLNDSLQFLTKDFWEYDTTTNAWTQRADFGGGVRKDAVGFSIGNKGYIGTGSDTVLAEKGTKDFWEYTPNSVCTAPANLTTTSITATSAQLNWNKVADATKYKLKVRRDSSGAPWYGTFINAPDTFFSVSNLQPGGKYAWKIKSICSSGKSDFSAVKKFTTLMRMSAEASSAAVAAVYPNPSNGAFEIDLSLDQQYSETATCEILDPTERVVSCDRVAIEDGLLHLSKSVQLPSGFYLVKINVEGSVYQAKLIIQKN